MHEIPQAFSPNDFLTYKPEGAFLTYGVINSIVVPRPVAFVTTLGASGVVNAAPFSYFNVVSSSPFLISIAIERRQKERKDTSTNIRTRKEFVVNICRTNLAHAIYIAGKDFPPEVSEIELTKLSLIPSKVIQTPRIANSPIQLECSVHQFVEIAETGGDLIIGKVVNIHILEEVLTASGEIDIEKLNPIARLAGASFATLSCFRAD